MFNWRLENKKDFYDVLVEWWNVHSFPVLEYGAVPNRIFVVQDDTDDLYAVPVYITDSTWCIIGFPTSNPEIGWDRKEGALDYLMGHLETCMKYEGIKTIMTTSSNPKLIEMFERNGIDSVEKNINFLAKSI